MLEDKIRINDLEALAHERGIPSETLESIYLWAACSVLELHGVQAEVRDAPPEADADVTVVVSDALAESGITSLFRMHGVDPQLGRYQFKGLVREWIRYGSESRIPPADEPIEKTLERSDFYADILKSTFSAGELEAAIRVERALARRGLSADQVDELLPPTL